MADIIKSNNMETESESNAITMKEGMIQTSSSLVIGATNLTVVSNLQDVSSKMNSCNESYRNLLRSHADSIAKLGKEFSDFDKDLSDKMGITQA